MINGDDFLLVYFYYILLLLFEWSFNYLSQVLPKYNGSVQLYKSAFKLASSHFYFLHQVRTFPVIVVKSRKTSSCATNTSYWKVDRSGRIL